MRISINDKKGSVEILLRYHKVIFPVCVGNVLFVQYSYSSYLVMYTFMVHQCKHSILNLHTGIEKDSYAVNTKYPPSIMCTYMAKITRPRGLQDCIKFLAPICIKYSTSKLTFQNNWLPYILHPVIKPVQIGIKYLVDILLISCLFSNLL